jgi:hypothetical protein
MGRLGLEDGRNGSVVGRRGGINGGILSQGMSRICRVISPRVSDTTTRQRLNRVRCREIPRLIVEAGLVQVLAKMLETSVHQGTTRSAVLSQDAVNIRGVWGFDMGASTWAGPTPTPTLANAELHVIDT